ncbi:MAG: NrpR regulatory domain-containing protein [Methanosarcinaceae archaeon]
MIRIEDLIYKSDYDLKSKTGDIIVNISNINKDDFDDVAGIMGYAGKGGAVISLRVRVDLICMTLLI